MDGDAFTEFESSLHGNGQPSQAMQWERGCTLPPSLKQEYVLLADEEDSWTGCNFVACVRLERELNCRMLRMALVRFVARHAILRTSFLKIDGRYAQVIAPAGSGFTLVEEEYGGGCDVSEVLSQESLRRIDPFGQSLIHGRLLRKSEADSYLLIDRKSVV